MEKKTLFDEKSKKKKVTLKNFRFLFEKLAWHLFIFFQASQHILFSLFYIKKSKYF